MRSDLFYQHKDGQSVSLEFISKAQWESSDFPDALRAALQAQQFKGRPGDVVLPAGQNNKAYVGSGDGSNMALAMAHAANRLPAGRYQLDAELSPWALLIWSLAQYRFDRYKKNESEARILLLDEASLIRVQQEAAALFLVRDLINTPTNDMGPAQLGEVMIDMANTFGADYEECIGDELLQDNYPAIHAVGRASIHQPRLLMLTWGDINHPRVSLVGKGVCFDSGGLDIKPSSAMRLMKKDMGGAANALGLAQWIMASRLPVRLQVLIPAVENAIGPDAFRPGDVLTMRNGLTVEIDNTDAEGRLVLADALVKAGEEEPELVVDFATLTGSARTAVGTEIAAMFCNDDALAQELMTASTEVNDPVWRLPLFAGYESMLDSSIADMVNSSASAYAGAITAALFLKRFVPAKASWVHFDIMAWNVSSKPGRPEGGEAMAVRAVAQYLQKKYAPKKD
ncbi:leucyl aminopeptidase family protein [Legionella sp. CNM-4043-24]|uniref:leucyl aminopeptidase family protein n=1 Tax=Legionella sp. CNM-4043-24 TaxID=3421646 RepID=UPI00403B1F7A